MREGNKGEHIKVDEHKDKLDSIVSMDKCVRTTCATMFVNIGLILFKSWF